MLAASVQRLLFPSLRNFNRCLAKNASKMAEPEEGSETSNVKQDDEGVHKKRMRFDYSSETLRKLNLDSWPYYIERAWWKEGNRMTFWAHWRMLQDIKRRRTVAEWGPMRMRYKAMKTNNILPHVIIDEFQERMNTMPKRAHPSLVIQMCQFTAKRRGKFNKYRVNRLIFRQLCDKAELSGVQRALW